MAETIIVQRAFRYRIYPSHAQQAKLNDTLGLCCELYNAALQERRDAYTIAHKAIHYNDQQNQLPEIKALRPELNTVHSQVLQNVLKRLDKAFDNFFRRVREQKAKRASRASVRALAITVSLILSLDFLSNGVSSDCLKSAR